jgi:hypothetical protein
MRSLARSPMGYLDVSDDDENQRIADMPCQERVSTNKANRISQTNQRRNTA